MLSFALQPSNPTGQLEWLECASRHTKVIVGRAGEGRTLPAPGGISYSEAFRSDVYHVTILKSEPDKQPHMKLMVL